MTLRSRQRRQAGGQVQSLEFGPNLPCFRAFQSASIAQSIPDNTETAVEFDCWENGNDNVFDFTVSGSPLVLTQVSALVEAVYSISFNVYMPDLSPPGNPDTVAAMAIEEGATDLTSPGVVYTAGPTAGANGQTMYSMTHVRGYPPVWLRCLDSTCGLAPCLPTWQFNFLQNSGAPVDITAAMIEIYLIGGLSVDTSELGP